MQRKHTKRGTLPKSKHQYEVSLTSSKHPSKEKTMLFETSMKLKLDKDKKPQPTDVVLVLDVSSSMAFEFNEHKDKGYTKKTLSNYKITYLPSMNEVLKKNPKASDPFKDLKPNRCEIYLRRESNGYTYCVVGKDKAAEEKGQTLEVINKGRLTLSHEDYSGICLFDGPINEFRKEVGLIIADLTKDTSVGATPDVQEIIFKALLRNKVIHKTAPIDILMKSLIDSIKTLPNGSCRFTIITFAANAERLVIHATPDQAIEKLRQIHCTGGTNINKGLALVTKEVLPDHLNGVIVLCTDGFNSTIQHIPNPMERETEALKEVDRALDAMTHEFNGQKVQMWTVGLGTLYLSSVVSKYAEKTGSAYYHLDKAQQISEFFKEKGSAIAAAKRIPMEFVLDIGKGYQIFSKKSPSGVSSNAPWTEVFECDISDLEDFNFELRYSTDEETLEQQGTFSTTYKIIPTIDLYGQKRATAIFGSQMTDPQKIIALQALLPIFEPFSQYPNFATTKNIQSMLQNLQTLSETRELTEEEIESRKKTMQAQLSQMNAIGGTGFFRIAMIESKELQYNPYENLIVINTIPHRIIDKHFDFSDAKHTSKPFVSVDEGETLEGTTINNEFLEHLKKNFNKFLMGKPSKNSKVFLAEMVAYIIHQFPNTNILEVKQHSVSSKFSYRKLNDCLTEHTASNRILALIIACILGKAVQNSLLSQGKVHRYRAVSYELKPHAWTVYDAGKEGLFIIDPLLATKDSQGRLQIKIYNLRNPKEALLAINAYEKLGLSGILENLFQEYRLIGHPTISYLTDKAISIAQQRSKDSKNIEMSNLCRASQKIMREPIILQTKDGRNEWYDYQITKKEIDAKIHPVTKKPLEAGTSVKKATGRLKKMWADVTDSYKLDSKESGIETRITINDIELTQVSVCEETLTDEMTARLPDFAPGSEIEMKEVVSKDIIIDIQDLEEEPAFSKPSTITAPVLTGSSSIFSHSEKELKASDQLKLNIQLLKALEQSPLQMNNIVALLTQGANPTYSVNHQPCLISRIIEDKGSKSPIFKESDIIEIKKAAGYSETDDWYIFDWNACQLLFTSNNEVKCDVTKMGSIARVFDYLEAKKIPYSKNGNIFNAQDGYHMLLSKDAHTKLQTEIKKGYSRLNKNGCAEQIIIFLKSNLPKNPKQIKTIKKSIFGFLGSSINYRAATEEELKNRYQMRSDIINAIFTALHYPGTDVECLQQMSKNLSLIQNNDSEFNVVRNDLLQIVNKKLESERQLEDRDEDRDEDEAKEQTLIKPQEGGYAKAKLKSERAAARFAQRQKISGIEEEKLEVDTRHVVLAPLPSSTPLDYNPYSGKRFR